MTKTWLIGGTSESAVIATTLVAQGQRFVVTVTTEAAIALYPDSDLMTVQVGAFSFSEMVDFMEREGIDRIIDASHPYAVEISQSAIALSQQFGVPYLRYERPHEATENNSHVIELDGFDALIKGSYLQQQRVLLTVGYKALPRFQCWHQQAVLFARILPTVSSLEQTLAAGFPQQQIIALRPPVSYELEKALCQQWEISLIVTKASGKAGGEDTKKAVAEALKIPLIVIRRPDIAYPQKTSTLEDVVKFCHQYG